MGIAPLEAVRQKLPARCRFCPTMRRISSGSDVACCCGERSLISSTAFSPAYASGAAAASSSVSTGT